MHIDFNLDRCLDAMREAREIGDLEAIMVDLTHALGFDQFAMGHHVDLVRPPEDAVRLTNYHPEWIARSLENRFFANDPVHAASSRVVCPFRWDEISLHIALTQQHLEILELAKQYGLVEGFTIPVHLPGEYQGTCSFGARCFEGLHPHTFALSHLAATCAFECARQMMRARDGRVAEPAPNLTDKQRESLILVGRGKTDIEIGTLMGISRYTAHDHVEASRFLYGYAQRTYLVVRALYDGVITFADIFKR